MLKNCFRCGQVHNNLSKYCEECEKIEAKIYRKVRDYLWENPNATVEEVHLETEVKRKKIRRYIREDKLVISQMISKYETDEKQKDLDR